ncbi:putative ribosomal pseudouridine synthase [Aphelenchoides bicaudatus]|nr:putative ribosomal pseudouridine synthase [Aphelenchoides bicaudatus]
MFEIDDEEVKKDNISKFEEVSDWSRLSDKDLLRLLTERVVYNTEDLIAFNKPAGLSYSGSKTASTKIDRVLQDLKKNLTEESDRLNLVESLDKCASGILLFAKSDERQKQLKDLINAGKVTHRFRAVVRGIPENLSADINIPLRKTLDGKDMRWVPLTRRTSNPILYETTRYRVVNRNRHANVSLLDIFVNKANVHQIRSHLGLGINCPLIGDAKYNLKKKNMPLHMGQKALEALGLGTKDSDRVPMTIHLAEVLVPLSDGSRFTVIKADYSPMEQEKMSGLGSELVKKVAQIEELGQSIVGAQASIVQMDQQRAKLREANHAINRLSTDQATSSKVYTADSLIEESRTELKQNVDKLRKLEGDKDLAELGFDLKSYQERISVDQ